MGAAAGYLSLFFLTVSIVYFFTKRRDAAPPADDRQRVRENFKTGTDRYGVEFDKCSFRDSSYSEEVEMPTNATGAIGLLVGVGTELTTSELQTVNNVQTVLFYKDPELFQGRRMHQVFPMELTTLKYHVLEGHMFLYVSRGNYAEYLFDVETGEA